MQTFVSQFFFRLAVGVAVALAAMPLRLVPVAFCRIALWGLTGLGALAALAVYAYPASVEHGVGVLTLALIMAAVSFAGSLLWRGEKVDAGRFVVGCIGLLALLALLVAARWGHETTVFGLSFGILDVASSAVLLGVTISTVLLGIWHLNTPKLESVPFQALTRAMAAALAARTILCPAAWWIAAQATEPPTSLFGSFLLLRWLLAALGVTMLAMLTKDARSGADASGLTGWLLLGVGVVMAGEFCSQLVPVALLYRV
jgi:hypothetical protein